MTASETATPENKPIVNVKEFKFSLVYASKFDETKAFYEKYFGFTEEFDMPDSNLGPQAFGTIGDVRMWIGGGFTQSSLTETSSRSGVMFGVDSVQKLFDELKKDSVTIHQDELVEMQPGVFWLVFEDPSGNIVEVLGGK